MTTGIAVANSPVYFGPSTSLYPSEGSSVGPNETVTIVWQEGSWYYIEYYVGATTTKKRMYIQTSKLSSISGTVTSKTLSGTTKTSSPATTYAGPGTGYQAAGSVGTESVTAFNEVSGSYTFIEYNISGGLRKRAYIETNKLSTSGGSPDNLVGTVLANLNSTAYSSSNMYYPNYTGECTWYCWGRAYEKSGKSLSFNGSNNGAQWYANVNTSNVTKRSASSGPVKNSIASFSGGSSGNGHVIFVEDVANGYTYFTEYNYTASQNAKLQKIATSSFATMRSNFSLNGYIVL